MSNANTTTYQDKVIEDAKHFAKLNDAAYEHITELVSVIDDLDEQLTEALKDKGDER